MATTKRTFHQGKMNLDVDERFLEKGEYREATNVETINSEGSDVGAVEKTLSNKKLTNIDLGTNPFEIGKFEDEAEDKIYWFVKSDTGTYLLEWDDVNQLVSVVLKDTRTEDVDRVLNLKKTNLITGIQKVISEDTKKDLLVWTDDNIEVCCINIERAKTWGENGFEKEDIYLIKKPPRYALEATPTYTNDGSNNLENKFPTFFYRYKYKNGEYSALSDPTNYKFYPKPFDLEYFTMQNVGMISAFNAIRLKFNTGEKQVTDVQVCAKFSNSNTIYIIETFNKAIKGWADNDFQNHTFSNSKLYAALPEKELFRSFDNIPLKAKSLSLIENIIVLGDYEEGMDVVDSNGNDIDVDYSVSLINTPVESGIDFDVTPTTNKLAFLNLTNETLVVGKQIYFNIYINLNDIPVYNNTFYFLIEKEYADLNTLVASIEFENFIAIINSDYVANYNIAGDYVVDPNYALSIETSLSFALETDVPTFTVEPVTYTDSGNGDAVVVVATSFSNENNIGIQEFDNASSCKSNMGYEVGLEYQDRFNRKIPILTSETNTLFVPQKFSVFKNRLRVNINSVAPEGADRYKICIKAKPLQYETIYINEFYNEDNYVWAKLVADNKDKVKVGDELIVKRAGDLAVASPVTVKVLAIETKEKNFITGNFDENENEIIESEGVYMQIRPTGFSMDLDDFSIYQNNAPKANSDNFPVTSLDLFSTVAPDPVSELAIGQGSSIYLFIHSFRFFDDGQKDKIFEKTFFAQRDYATLEDWFNEVLLNGNSIPAPEVQTELIDDYKDNITLERVGGKLYLRIVGLYAGGTRNRKGYVLAKIVIRSSTGFYAFETTPKQAESETFYQTEQCFDIVNGNHQGTDGNHQDADNFTPAVVDLDFYNCYSQGNGVESYKYKDGFNTNYLNIDLRPSTTSIEKPRKIRRFADLTYGQPFVESSGLNGLNEFNASTGNFKELDKQYGSVQRLFSRDTDLLVWQEDKFSRVLFGKDLLSMANGDTVLSATPSILEQQVPVPGENGISKNPESLAWDDFRFYYTNARRGTPIRLSRDGTSEINYGTIAHFRDLFINNPTSYKIGGYDPYHRKYVLTSEDEDTQVFNSSCGNSISKTITEPFSYYLNLNALAGDITLSYFIEGEVAIDALYDSVLYQVPSAIGSGSQVIPRPNGAINEQVFITITPIIPSTIQITNNCPTGIGMNLFSIVLNSEGELGKNIINRYRYGSSGFYSDNHLFEAFEISKFLKETGIEGVGKFPERTKTINLQSYEDTSSTSEFVESEGNKLGYLVSENDYAEGDIATILSEATFLSVSESQIGVDSFINQGSFVFNRPTNISNLYLIWDYRRNPAIPSCDSGMDVVFIFDYTSSMAPQIETAKTGAANIISTIETQSGTNNYRLGLVIADETQSANFSGYSSDTEYTSLPAPQKFINAGPDIGVQKFQWITAMEMMSENNSTSFITQLNKLNNDVDGLALGAGQGTPEPMDIALSRVVENDFSGSFRVGVARYVIMITDAAPSGDDDVNDAIDMTEINRLTQVCINNQVKVVVLGAGVNYSYLGEFPWRILAEGTGGSWSVDYDVTTIQTEIISNCTI